MLPLLALPVGAGLTAAVEAKRPRSDLPPPPSLVSALDADVLAVVLQWAHDSEPNCDRVNEICTISREFAEWCRTGRDEAFWEWACALRGWDQPHRLFPPPLAPGAVEDEPLWDEVYEIVEPYRPDLNEQFEDGWDEDDHEDTYEVFPLRWQEIDRPASWKAHYRARCDKQLTNSSIRRAIRDMRSLWDRAHPELGRVSEWNTSKVTNMDKLFKDDTLFNQPIGGWNTSKVTTMRQMFRGAEAFNQAIGSWDTSNVISMYKTFRAAVHFNQDIGGWDTSRVTTMNGMFYEAYDFNQDIGKWITRHVTDMEQMFENAESFNQDIGCWDTSSVIDMSGIFAFAKTFDQDIGRWNTLEVRKLSYAFNYTEAFDQDLSRWELPNVTQPFYLIFYKSAMRPEHCPPRIAEAVAEADG
jgi:surface protein